MLSLPLPYVRCLLSRSRMCLGRHCRGHPVHVSQVGGCPQQHQHPHMKPPAAFTPFPTPRPTHQPHLSRGRSPSGPLLGPPPPPQRHHRHDRPRQASITVVYVTLSQMRVLHRSGAHHTPFLQLPEWPQYRLYHQYLTQTARATGHTLLGNQDMKTAYRDFKKQHPRPIPVTPPYTPSGTKHEPVLW